MLELCSYVLSPLKVGMIASEYLSEFDGDIDLMKKEDLKSSIIKIINLSDTTVNIN